MAGILPSNLFSWLRNRISGVVPGWFRAMFLGRPIAKQLYFSGQVSKITHEKRGRVSPASWLINSPRNSEPKRRAQLSDVYFPPSVFLERRVTIPNGAAKNAAKIVELDMVRRTPFRPQEVHWTYSKPNNTDEVIQWVAKKSDIQEIVENLANNHIAVRNIFVDAPNAMAAVAELETRISRPVKVMRSVNLTLAAITVCFLMIAWLYPAWKLSGETKIIQNETENLRTQAVQVRADVDGYRLVETSKSELLTLLRERTRLSEVLRDLTVALPDTAWSDNLVFSSTRMVFSGTTKASAPELVLQLSRSKLFENPRLSGPVSRTNTGGERFEIAAEFRVN